MPRADKGSRPATGPSAGQRYYAVKSIAETLSYYLRKKAHENNEQGHCRACGGDVIWARKLPEDGGEWHSPLEPHGYALTIIDSTVYRFPTYRRHQCDPKRKQAYAEEQARLADERARREEEHRDWWQDAENPRVQLARLEDKARRDFPCPRCEVGRDANCLNLSKLRRGDRVPNKHPHPERVALLLNEHPEMRPDAWPGLPPASGERPAAQ
jgi:hypothetical protein